MRRSENFTRNVEKISNLKIKRNQSKKNKKKEQSLLISKHRMSKKHPLPQEDIKEVATEASILHVIYW
jgi:hypothetical protein